MRLGVRPEATVATSGAGSSAGFQPSARSQQQQPVERRSLIMSLGQMDPALVCSGPMSNLSYDSHIVTRCIVARVYWKLLCNGSVQNFSSLTGGGWLTSCLGCSRTRPPTATPPSKWTWRSSEWLESSTKHSPVRIQNSRRCVIT